MGRSGIIMIRGLQIFILTSLALAHCGPISVEEYGNLDARGLDGLGHGNILRALDSLGSGNILRRVDRLGGGNILRRLDSLGGGNVLRRLDSLGGGNVLRSALDSLLRGNIL